MKIKTYNKWVVIGSETGKGVSYSVRSYCEDDKTLCGGSWKPRTDSKYVDPKGAGTNLFSIMYIVDSKRDGEKIRDALYTIAKITGKNKVPVCA